MRSINISTEHTPEFGHLSGHYVSVEDLIVFLEERIDRVRRRNLGFWNIRVSELQTLVESIRDECMPDNESVIDDNPDP